MSPSEAHLESLQQRILPERRVRALALPLALSTVSMTFGRESLIAEKEMISREGMAKVDEF
jgi:hypothetical protein